MRKTLTLPAKLFIVSCLFTIAGASCAKPNNEGCKTCTVIQNGSSFNVEGCGEYPEGSLYSQYPGAEITCH